MNSIEEKDGINPEVSAVNAQSPARRLPCRGCTIHCLFGGFGLSYDPDEPFKAANPMDVWVSKDGANWRQVSDSPWNAATPEESKYDFDALVVRGGRGG